MPYYHWEQQKMGLFSLFETSQKISFAFLSIRHQFWLDKAIKSEYIILNLFSFRKIYLQYVVNYNRVATQQGLPNSQ